MSQKALIDKLLKASSMISESRRPKADFVQIHKSNIQRYADFHNLSYDEVVAILDKENIRIENYKE